MSETNWIPGLVVLLMGLMGGIVFVLLSRRTEEPGEAGDASLDDLEQRYNLILNQIRELDADRHQLAPAQYEADKTRLEQDAAQTLRAKDSHLRGKKHEDLKEEARAQRLQKAKEAAAQTFFGRNPALKGGLWGRGAGAVLRGARV